MDTKSVDLHNIVGIRYGADEVTTRSEIIGSVTDRTFRLWNAFEWVMESELAANNVKWLILVFKQFVYFHLR